MINLLTKKTNTLTASAGIIAFFTLLAQLLSFAKNKIFATEFGASEILDLYNTAFKIPDIIFLVVGMMVAGSILIPFLEEKSKKSEKDYQNFITQIFFSFSAGLITTSAVVFLLMPWLVGLLFPGFQGSAQIELIQLSRLMLLSPIIMGMANIFIAVNQKSNSFVPVALTGVFYNLAVIASVYWFYPIWGVAGLVAGVILGACFYLVLQIPSMLKNNTLPRDFKILPWQEFSHYLKKSFPRSLALFIASLIPIFLYAQASKMATGSITIMQFAISLYFVPISLITTSFSLASFPRLSKHFSEDDRRSFSQLVIKVISHILFFVVPVALYFMFFSPEINGFLFGSQKFGIQEINLISKILIIFSIIIVIQSLNIIFSRILYAAKNTSLTMISSSLSLGSIILFFFLFQGQLGHSLTFLALLFLVGNLLAFFFLLSSIKIKLKDHLNLKEIYFRKKVIISLVAMVLARLLVGLPNFVEQQRFWQYFKILFVGGLFFLIFYIIISELWKEKSYLGFKKEIIKFFKIRKI